jgi:nitrous oxidase accessory protein NosD
MMTLRLCCVFALILLALGARAGVTTAATNEGLTALPSSSSPVLRMGYHVPGDAPPLSYTASSSGCPLGAGRGDGGSQIPTSDGKCWIASFPADGVDVREFGAVCQSFNGSLTDADDTVAIQNALNFAGAFTSPATVRLPGAGNKLCKISGELIVAQGVTFTGAGSKSVYSGLVVGAPNIPLLVNVTGNNATVTSMMIDAFGSQIQSTTGVTIAINSPKSTDDTVRDVYIKQPCFGLTISGSRHHIDNLTINGTVGSGCVGIQVGGSTTSGASSDLIFHHVIISSNPANPAAVCMNILDAGGITIEDSDMVWCAIGTQIKPGPNQWFNWGFFHDTALGDTGVSSGLLIDTGASSSRVVGLNCADCWFSSSSGGNGATLKNSGRGAVRGIDFNSARALSNAGVGIDIEPGVTEVTVENSQVCASAGEAGIYLAAGAGEARIVNDTITPTCDDRPAPRGSTVGIDLVGSNADVVVTGNDLRGNTDEIDGIPAGDSVVSGNVDLANRMPIIASASSITLPAGFGSFQITGSTAVTAITGGWPGRTVTLITPDANLPLAGCAAFVSTKAVPAIGLFNGACWWWK